MFSLLLLLVFYLDANDIVSPDLEDSIYAPGTLKVHHVDRISTETVNLYFNRCVFYSVHHPKLCFYEQIPCLNKHCKLLCFLLSYGNMINKSQSSS